MGIREYLEAVRGLQSAEGRHAGVLRGGHTDGEFFFYNGKGCWKVPVSEVTEFKVRGGVMYPVKPA